MSSQRRPSSVTLTLHDVDAGGHGHRFGINCVASDELTGRIYTAGRDGTIRGWDVPLPVIGAEHPSSARCACTLDDHSDWVNDIVMLNSNLIASASSDQTVKLWSLQEGGSVGGGGGGETIGSHQWRSETIGRHEDYARALGYAPGIGLLASAGFDRRLLLWDGHRVGQSGTQSGRHGNGPVAATDPATGHTDSIYALHCDDESGLIATGSADADVRLWDPRDMRASLRLGGHTDVVRGVQLLPDGRRLLSCGSDQVSATAWK